MKPAQNQLPASNFSGHSHISFYPKRVFVHQEICLVTDYPCPWIIKKQNVVLDATGDTMWSAIHTMYRYVLKRLSTSDTKWYSSVPPSSSSEGTSSLALSACCPRNRRKLVEFVSLSSAFLIESMTGSCPKWLTLSDGSTITPCILRLTEVLQLHNVLK